MSNSDANSRASFLKSCPVKDLRIECRNRGISPAGGRETLMERLSSSMAASGETRFGGAVNDGTTNTERFVNNYVRPEGQNVGNFITDRKSSRVLAPPGGQSSVSFFGASAPSMVVGKPRSTSPVAQPPPPVSQPTPVVEEKRPSQTGGGGGLSLADNEYARQAPEVGVRGGDNNYARPGQRQNVGNYITGRNTSRVLAPPGGGSSVSFG
eukprot:g1639.t1